MLDARIMYHKVQKKGQRSFTTIFYILFGKRVSLEFSNWDQRPLSLEQLKTAGVDVQNLVHMVHKLKFLGANKHMLH